VAQKMWKDYFKGILNSDNSANASTVFVEHNINCKNYLGTKRVLCSFVSLTSLLQKLPLNKAPVSDGNTQSVRYRLSLGIVSKHSPNYKIQIIKWWTWVLLAQPIESPFLQQSYVHDHRENRQSSIS